MVAVQEVRSVRSAQRYVMQFNARIGPIGWKKYQYDCVWTTFRDTHEFMSGTRLVVLVFRSFLSFVVVSLFAFWRLEERDTTEWKSRETLKSLAGNGPFFPVIELHGAYLKFRDLVSWTTTPRLQLRFGTFDVYLALASCHLPLHSPPWSKLCH